MAGYQRSQLLLLADMTVVLTLLPGHFNQLFFLPAARFAEREGFFPLLHQSLVYPGELLIAGVLPGFRRRAGHIKEAIGDFDVGREKLAGHLIPQQLIGNETKRGQILRVARVMDSLPAAECVASPASRASVVKLTGTVPLTILR